MLDSSPDAPVIVELDVAAILADPDRITMVAQPIVDLSHGVIVGYETLARFSIGKPAPPDRVFLTATRCGLGEELESVVLKKALALARSRPPSCFVTVNVDPLHLLSSKVAAVVEAERDVTGVVFELTEHRSIEDVQSLRRALDDLRKRGAFIAIDDAGSGYSGLKQILEIRPQFLKIDRDLVSSVHDNEAKRALVQMLGELAGRLDAWVIAEGVETEAELHALAHLGVPLVQGYFLARPSAPWTALAPDVDRALARVATPIEAGATIAGLVEPCAIVAASEAWRDDAKVCVRVDSASRRPASMRLAGCNGVRVRAADELLRVKRDDSLPEIGLRAAARPERLRWDPLVCVDDRGGLEGMVPMERLVCALAESGA